MSTTESPDPTVTDAAQGECCDECDATGATDDGHAILCVACRDEWDEYDGPTEAECVRAERTQMGITS